MLTLGLLLSLALPVSSGPKDELSKMRKGLSIAKQCFKCISSTSYKVYASFSSECCKKRTKDQPSYRYSPLSLPQGLCSSFFLLFFELGDAAVEIHSNLPLEFLTEAL
ncbi:hypothetical protein Naga_100060g18 [Nannochloropsis gaditana]|uniref:Uncharacterized protein n=1 Tax=Nannochloropsis gaditana TaxID=72520 RepID=W7TN26_9STRA|nr:hypothetical protein Naga_100060g18 [Nannochloropsis gaditana]